VTLTVDRDRLVDPNDTRVWRYAGGGTGYESLDTRVQSVSSSEVELAFDTTGFSVFVVGDPVSDTGGSGGGDTGVGESILTAERSVTQRLYDGTARRVTVAFDRETTGAVTVESVEGLPEAAPDLDGRTVAAVDVTVPDDAAGRSVTVEIAVPRSAVEGAGVDSAALRIVEFERGAGAYRRLDTDVVESGGGTVVLAAETTGVSTTAVVAPTDRGTTGAPASTRTRTATPGRSPTATSTATPGETATSTAAATTRGPESTEGSGDGLGWIAALVALLAAGASARRD
jgi:hypothetical protein